MRVEIWRGAVKMAAYAKHRELQAGLEMQMRAQGQGAGVRQMKLAMVRMVKGEVGMRVAIWHMWMKDGVRGKQMDRMRSELEARAANGRKGAALRQMKQIMVRMVKGEVGLRVEIWRGAVKMAAYAKHREVFIHCIRA